MSICLQGKYLEAIKSKTIIITCDFNILRVLPLRHALCQHSSHSFLIHVDSVFLNDEVLKMRKMATSKLDAKYNR